MKLKHKLTGTIYEVEKQTKKTVYMKVVSIGNTYSLKVGMKQKTSPAAIGVNYIVID
jgi:hypothetical protein